MENPGGLDLVKSSALDSYYFRAGVLLRVCCCGCVFVEPKWGGGSRVRGARDKKSSSLHHYYYPAVVLLRVCCCGCVFVQPKWGVQPRASTVPG